MSRKIEFSFLGLVQVPRHIGLYRVKPEILRQKKVTPPLGRVYPEIMNVAGR